MRSVQSSSFCQQAQYPVKLHGQTLVMLWYRQASPLRSSSVPYGGSRQLDWTLRRVLQAEFFLLLHAGMSDVFTRHHGWHVGMFEQREA